MRSDSAPSDSDYLEVLQCSLGEYLHAAAQPLTILRTRFDASFIEQMTEAQLRESVLCSGAQIEDLCAMISQMRHLLEMTRSQPLCTSFDLRSMLECVLADTTLLAFENRLSLQSNTSEVTVQVCADRGKVQQALSLALLSTCEYSKPHETVTLNAVVTEDGVGVTVFNPDTVLHPRQRLLLAMVEANLRLQGGALHITPNPFLLRLDLPRAASTTIPRTIQTEVRHNDART